MCRFKRWVFAIFVWRAGHIRETCEDVLPQFFGGEFFYKFEYT